jgi:hypothetical protein
VSKGKRFALRTVDGDGDALVESVAIGADKGWDLPKLVDLEVLGGDAFRWLGLNDLEVNVVGLGNCTNSSGAGVALWRRQRLALDLKEYIEFNRTGYV